MSLLELAERVERAEGPDRELDFWISVRLNPSPGYTDADYQEDIDRIGIEGMVVDASYTASLDAAMSLVPEGMEVALYWGTPGFKPNAQLENGEMRSRFEFEPHNGEAATIALALCAAALRARASVEMGRE